MVKDSFRKNYGEEGNPVCLDPSLSKPSCQVEVVHFLNYFGNWSWKINS